MNLIFGLCALGALVAVTIGHRTTMTEMSRRNRNVAKRAPEGLIAAMESRGEKNVRERMEKRKERLANMKGRRITSNKSAKEIQELIAKTESMFDKDTEANEYSIANVNAPILDYFYQGDIALTEEQLSYLEKRNARTKRGAPLTFVPLWDKRKPIAYSFHQQYPEEKRQRVRRYAQELVKNTCLSVNETGGANKFIYIYNGVGCSSNLGSYSPTYMSLNVQGCMPGGSIQHEFMHALGIDHTQTRYDRDNYVTILTDNIEPQTEHNFERNSESDNNNYGLTYDYESAMHYGTYYFPKAAGLKTLATNDPKFTFSVGQQKYTTFQDIKMINLMYNCQESCPTKIVCQNGGYQNPKNCNQCVCNEFYKGAFCESSFNDEHIFTESDVGHSLTEQFKINFWLNDENLYKQAIWDYSDHYITTMVARAPKGRRFRVKIIMHKDIPCSENCHTGGISVVDGTSGDLNGPGMIFCCTKHNNTEFETKSNLVGFKGFFPYYKDQFYSFTTVVI